MPALANALGDRLLRSLASQSPSARHSAASSPRCRRSRRNGVDRVDVDAVGEDVAVPIEDVAALGRRLESCATAGARRAPTDRRSATPADRRAAPRCHRPEQENAERHGRPRLSVVRQYVGGLVGHRTPFRPTAARRPTAAAPGSERLARSRLRPPAGATMRRPSGRHALDPRRRLERLDLEPQVPVHRLLGGALLLHLLEPIAVAEQLEVLPGREEQHEDEEDADPTSSATSRGDARDRPRGRSGCCGRLS